MNAKIEDLSPVKKKISFEIPSERVDSEIEKVYAHIRKYAAIPGFRKGKAPLSFIERHYSDRMTEDVLKNLVNETYFKAIQEHKIVPVDSPEIESGELRKGSPLTYSATVEVMPEVVAKDYAGLEVVREKFVMDESMVESRLAQLRENMARIEPVEESRPVAKGDFVIFDFKGFVGGEPIENGEAQGYQLEIGSGQFIPGFEDQLVGVKPGDEKEISVTFPESYGSNELAGKEATFEVKVNEIKEKVLPELNDDFAKDMGDFETLEELRQKIVETYEKQERDRIDAEFRDRLIGSLVERNQIDIPEAMIQRQLQYMLENAKNRLSQQRMTMEMMGLDDETFNTQYRDAAISQIRGDLLLDAVARQEGVTVEEQDIEAEIGKLAAAVGQPVDVVKKYYSSPQGKENLSARVREEKVISFLKEKGSVTEVSKEELKK